MSPDSIRGAATRYISRVAALTSQGVNCILLFGHHDMTVSARAHIRACQGSRAWSRVRDAIDAAFRLWHEDHCLRSFCRDYRYAMQVKSIHDQTFTGCGNEQ